MKRTKRLTGVVYVLSLVSVAATAAPTNAPWSAGTAHTLPKGRFEVGMFQPLRYGQTESLEWSTHPILDFLIPNVTIKISHSQFHEWYMATRHSLVYPTPLLRKLRIKGFGIQALADMDVGGIISGDPDIPQIPHMVSSRNEVILSRSFGRSTLVTVKVGLVLAIKTGELDSRTTIDLPIVFSRLGVYYNGYGVNAGADVLRDVTKRVDFLIDADVFLLPGLDEDFAFEHKGLIVWNKSLRFRLAFGYKLVFGEYPFGTQWHLLPLFDLQWARERGK
ncbi:hypothetical protein ISS37_09535 [candidate division KSB1 bacterium]|nr:hypothetical protein [candidate division KSB1 bacterium]